ncbi:3-hydroxyisobutyrate dehydrogenase [Bradyrhizobium sp. CIR48]|uniref:NAD(P)-dependent oxidoreductase n=1 Tax=Bradyrhizobium sp. CIR48 TaxID=2663840 RepID=UPI001606A9F0|nr:NAD(P)-dependent oxidoreductase [Bradyrhizobium sp. CIR48]MBB4427580.1 3-hydroxyisobutyrate dehydrogenase [Bradyrhizobium sp. CIR48]
MTRVGMIGLGLMGRSIAANLVKAGFDVTAYDVRPEAEGDVQGLRFAKSPAEVVKASDTVLLSLPGPKEVEEICVGERGLAAALNPGAQIVDLSTNSVAMVRALNKTLGERNIAFLDAPVSGGPVGAADGTLAIWVGGSREAFEKTLPVLEAIGKYISYMGDIGTGTITKLAHNVVANIRTAMLGEVLTLGVKGGIAPEELLAAVRNGSHGRTRTFDSMAGKILDGTFDTPLFRLRHARKDMAVALELGEELGVPLDLTRLTLAKLDEAMDRGWGDRDSNVHIKIQQEKSGINIPSVSPEVLKAIVSRP